MRPRRVGRGKGFVAGRGGTLNLDGFNEAPASWPGKAAVPLFRSSRNQTLQ